MAGKLDGQIPTGSKVDPVRMKCIHLTTEESAAYLSPGLQVPVTQGIFLKEIQRRGFWPSQHAATYHQPRAQIEMQKDSRVGTELLFKDAPVELSR